jgi:predicted glycosyltransferase
MPETALGERAGARVLIYSHDSFGLGHLRRCRTIAHALVAADPDLSVLILSGSPIIGSFEFGDRVDFVRIPGVIKLSNGDYTSLGLSSLDVVKTIALREAIIRQTADTFDPDLFIVDKEPLGLRGEVVETLKMLSARGTKCVLGLRDVLDEPALLAPEWDRKHVLPALEDAYDEIWIYGLPQIYDTLGGIALPDSVRRKIVYTGYLRAAAPASGIAPPSPPFGERPYLLVTAGGGGDGEALFDWVLNAYEADRSLPHPALIVLGPFMQTEVQDRLLERAAALSDVAALTFETHLEHLMSRAAGVVAMGGYNTFCEILSFDKPSLLIPRTQPRLEQYIRAARAQELGLAALLPDDGIRDGRAMATALRQLIQQRRPSDVVIPGLMDGLDNINRLVGRGMVRRLSVMGAAS